MLLFYGFAAVWSVSATITTRQNKCLSFARKDEQKYEILKSLMKEAKTLHLYSYQPLFSLFLGEREQSVDENSEFEIEVKIR